MLMMTMTMMIQKLMNPTMTTTKIKKLQNSHALEVEDLVGLRFLGVRGCVELKVP